MKVTFISGNTIDGVKSIKFKWNASNLSYDAYIEFDLLRPTTVDYGEIASISDFTLIPCPVDQDEKFQVA